MVAQAGLQAAPDQGCCVTFENDVRRSRRLTQQLVAVPVVTATYSGPI